MGLGACGTQSSEDGNKGEIYYLNSKPEAADQFKELGEQYAKETGVKVDIQTATNDNYDSSLTSELSKSKAPTMFNVSGYSTYAKVKNYLAPLDDSAVFKLLTPDGKTAAMRSGGKSYTVPFVAEYNGILYNKKIVNDYAKKSYAVIKSDKDIKDYATLKKVVESMQKHKGDLGLDGAWTSPTLDSSGNYRFGDHMARVPVSAELRDEGKTFAPEITGKYVDNFKDMFDLQVNNNPRQSSTLGAATLDDATSQFSSGKTAFYNDGSWTWANLKDSGMQSSDIGMLPYWMGIPGEEAYGAMAVLDTQWGVNAKAPKKDQKASLDFMKWMVSTDKGRKALIEDMGFSIPFTTAKEQPDNPAVKAAVAYSKEGKKFIFNVSAPSQEYKDGINNALVEYAQGTGKWDKVQNAFINGWKTEWANNQKVLGSLPESLTVK